MSDLASLAGSTQKARVHILGLGSIGTFAAHSLSELPNPPSVTLLLHRRSLLDHYRQNGNRILFESREGDHLTSTDYELETLQENQWYHVSSNESDPRPDKPIAATISHLIICVKATQTVSALRPLKHRLTSTSNILFLQNGSGMIEQVNANLFPDPASRPNYLVGVISHGVTLNGPFNITHTGVSATAIGPVPRADTSSSSSSSSLGDKPTVVVPPSQSNYFLQALPLSQTLNLAAYTYTGILQIQLEKLAVNAFCNPLCALNDAKNGFLFTVPDTRRAILTEISNVVFALPALKGEPGLKDRFSVDGLERTVNGIIARTANTTCSMVWDLRAGRETEIQFINGSWSRMGREVGVETPVNDRLVEEITMRTK
ncbi:ketopantoate reductase PanE/ApbA-domain-containing protein [Aspergillus germanicus]